MSSPLSEISACRPPSRRQARTAVIQPARLSLPAARIVQAVSDVTGISTAEIRAQGKEQPRFLARAAAMRLMREMLGWSLPRIGRQFGGRHHTSVLSALRSRHEEIEMITTDASLMLGVRRETMCLRAATLKLEDLGREITRARANLRRLIDEAERLLDDGDGG